MKNPATIVPTQFATMNAATTQHVIRSVRLTKIRRYSTKIANFGKTTAGRYSMGTMRVYFAQVMSFQGEVAATAAR